jgi:zinc protease
VPPRGGANDVATLVLNDAFAGSFSSRVNMNLREDKHWSYGSFSLLESARGDRPYLVVAPVQTDKTADSIKELANEYARIGGAQPLSPEELRQAQQRQTLKLPGNFETSAQLAGAYRTIVGYGLPTDYYETFVQKASATTPQSVEALARQLVDPKRITWVVVGDLSKIEPGIRALNLGEVKKIDVDGKPVN